MKIRLYISCLLLCILAASAMAQKKMHVITRVSQETYVFKKDFLLEIDAEKATINITNSNTSNIVVILKQTVKNTNKALAEKHLDAHKASFKKERERLFLRNYILFESGSDNTTSLFSSVYEIKVPSNCHLKISNSLGDVNITGINGHLASNIEYGKLNIQDFNGPVTATLKIGDLSIKNSTIEANLNISNVITRISGCGGNFDITSNFGTISQVLTNEISNLNIEADNTEISIINKNNFVFNVFVKNKNGAINLLTDDKISTEGEFRIFNSKSSQSVGDIRIIAEYGDVSIY